MNPMQTFQDQLRDYYRVDRELIGLKKRKGELQMQILEFIKSRHLEKKRFVLADRVLRYQQTQPKGGFTQKLVLDALTDYLKDITEARQVMQMILSRRETHDMKDKLIFEVRKT